jgi:hypothetical protein
MQIKKASKQQESKVRSDQSCNSGGGHRESGFRTQWKRPSGFFKQQVHEVYEEANGIRKNRIS